ncbi:YciI family protein [Streptomyces sp. NPDC019531]|uniref:YciI family protein n=1 Tax=Streptomyces sp. NPDC019531 TaxID=3365062 RepID=UPI00384D622A
MKYMLLVCGDDTNDASDMAPVEPWVEELGDRGVRLHGHRLALPADAVTVRVRSGEVLRSDGPFAETKEYVAGFDILECDSLDEAVRAAAKHPVATIGAMEVRPFWEDEDAEREIRGLDAELTDAARERDAERITACYAPDAETSHLAHGHKTLEDLMAGATGPLVREVLESRLHTDESIAFGHALVRLRTDRERVLRVTTGYRDTGLRWSIVHEHTTEVQS